METAKRFEKVLANHRIKLFNEINHSENIGKVDHELMGEEEPAKLENKIQAMVQETIA
ncbi:hypothetical protein [Tissierella creatinophila]|uniref:hypothetical protein n=1 Tax=Tissierella creatinophila TaxID=79681 RepID=UPI0013010ABF|nr:hypothetical protein [Tissierella creatinophila]